MGNTLVITASIYDLKGTLLNELKNPTAKIDVSYLENGIYFIRLNTNLGLVSRKIVIAK